MLAVELEHAIAFSGRSQDSLCVHPDGRHYLTICGRNVIAHDTEDPHLQTFLSAHDDVIRAVCVSPCGRYVASGQRGENADVVVWKTKVDGGGGGDGGGGKLRARLLYRLAEHYTGVRAVGFSHDSRFLCTIGKDQLMYVWDMATGNIVAVHRMTNAATADWCRVQWGGRVTNIKGRATECYRLATVVGNQVHLWSLTPSTGELTSLVCNEGSFQRTYTCLDFSSHGHLLYAGSESGDVFVFNTRTGKRTNVVRCCGGGVWSLATLPSEHGPAREPLRDPLYPLGFVVGGGDGSVTTFYTYDGKEYLKECSVCVDGIVTSVTLNPRTEQVWIGTKTSTVYRAAWWRPGDASSSSSPSSSPSVAVQCVAHHPNERVVGVAFPRGVSDHFYTCCRDGGLRKWDITDYSVLMKAAVALPNPVCMDVCRDTAVVGYADGTIRGFLPYDDGRLLWEVAGAHEIGGVTAVTISKNHKFIVSGGADGTVRAWELRTRRLMSTLKEHRQAITSLVMYDDNIHLVSVSRDRLMVCWDLQLERRVSAHRQKVGGINCAVLSRDQRHVITGGQEKSITFWDLKHMEPSRVIAAAHDGETTCLAVSPTSEHVIASGGTDRVLKLWNTVTGECIAQGAKHAGDVQSCAFSADGKQVVSACEHGGVYVWNLYF